MVEHQAVNLTVTGSTPVDAPCWPKPTLAGRECAHTNSWRATIVRLDQPAAGDLQNRNVCGLASSFSHAKASRNPATAAHNGTLQDCGGTAASVNSVQNDRDVRAGKMPSLPASWKKRIRTIDNALPKLFSVPIACDQRTFVASRHPFIVTYEINGVDCYRLSIPGHCERRRAL